MAVYADILIITNFIVDYFLLKITARIIKSPPKLWRSLLSSLFASFTSLIIFLPQQNAIIESALRLIASLSICLICFGYISFRRLLRAALVFFAVTFCYAGAMTAIWYIFKPYGMAINNSVVYFSVTPIFLIGFSVAGFIIFTVFSSFVARHHATAKNCLVTLVFCGKQADFTAVIDSGNSLSDTFTGRAVVIADAKKCRMAFGELSAEIYPEKYRAVPCSTVSGSSLLDGFRCDSGKITSQNKTVNLICPIMALSSAPLCDCDAIVNPLDCP